MRHHEKPGGTHTGQSAATYMNTLPEYIFPTVGHVRFHDFGTEFLQRTGNLALVLRGIGQTSTKAAMQVSTPRFGACESRAEHGAYES